MKNIFGFIKGRNIKIKLDRVDQITQRLEQLTIRSLKIKKKMRIIESQMEMSLSQNLRVILIYQYISLFESLTSIVTEGDKLKVEFGKIQEEVAKLKN